MGSLELELIEGLPVLVTMSQEKGEPLSSEELMVHDLPSYQPMPFSMVSVELNIDLASTSSPFIGTKGLYELINN